MQTQITLYNSAHAQVVDASATMMMTLYRGRCSRDHGVFPRTASLQHLPSADLIGGKPAGERRY
jgi:hypothetical protein